MRWICPNISQAFLTKDRYDDYFLYAQVSECDDDDHDVYAKGESCAAN